MLFIVEHKMSAKFLLMTDQQNELSQGIRKECNMKFYEQKTLITGWNNEAGTELPVNPTLLVGEKDVLEYIDGNDVSGFYTVSIRPCFHKGEKAFLKKEVWNANYGYSAVGTFEAIIDFEEGVRIFLEQGVYDFDDDSNLVSNLK